MSDPTVVVVTTADGTVHWAASTSILAREAAAHATQVDTPVDDLDTSEPDSGPDDGAGDDTPASRGGRRARAAQSEPGSQPG